MSAVNVGSASEFWAEVRGNIAVVTADISKQELQPRDGACYIISIKQRNILPNQVSIATIKLASQRITEGSHRICTDQEIRAYLNHQKSQAETLRKMELAKKNTTTFSVAPNAS